MGNNVSSDGGGGRAHSATHTIATTGRISSQPIHRRTHSSSSGRLGRFNLFNSSRGNSSVDLAQTDASMAADMSMRSSSGGRLPPVPGRGLLFSRKMLRRQSDVPLSVSMPLSARDNLDRVTEVVNENGDHGIHSGDDGGPLTRSSTSPRDDPDYSSGFVRQERSHSEGTGIVTISTRRTTSEREEELAMLHRIRKFSPLIPDQPANYFSLGNWLTNAAGGNHRYIEPDTAIDEQALSGTFLAYRLNQRGLCETICRRQQDVVSSIKLLNEYAGHSEQLTAYQCRTTRGTTAMFSKEIAGLESQVLKTRELVHDIMQTLVKLNDMLGNNRELSLGSKSMQKQYPAVARAFKQTVATEHPGVINIEKKRLSIQHRRWDRSSVLLTVNPVLAEGSTHVVTALAGNETRRPLSPQPSSEMSSATGPSMSTARLRQFVHHDNNSSSMMSQLSRETTTAPIATSSSSSLPGVLEHHWASPLRSPSFWARSITRRPVEMDTADQSDSTLDLRRQNSVLSESSVDFDTMLQLGCRPTLPETPTPKRSAPSLANMAPPSLSPSTSSVLTAKEQHETRLTRSLNGPPPASVALLSSKSSQNRAVPYDAVNGRNSLKRQRARLTTAHTDGTLFEGILRKLNLSASPATGSVLAQTLSDNTTATTNEKAQRSSSVTLRQRTSSAALRGSEAAQLNTAKLARRQQKQQKQRSQTSSSTSICMNSNTTTLSLSDSSNNYQQDTNNHFNNIDNDTNEQQQSYMLMTQPITTDKESTIITTTPISRRRTKGKVRHGLFPLING